MKKDKPARMTAPRMLEAVVKAPGQKPRVTLISDTREAFGSIVGGRIQIVSFTEENVIICNEEGRLMKLQENVMGIYGPMIVLGRGDGERLGNVFDPRGVCELLRGRQPEEERV